MHVLSEGVTNVTAGQSKNGPGTEHGKSKEPLEDRPFVHETSNSRPADGRETTLSAITTTFCPASTSKLHVSKGKPDPFLLTEFTELADEARVATGGRRALVARLARYEEAVAASRETLTASRAEVADLTPGRGRAVVAFLGSR